MQFLSSTTPTLRLLRRYSTPKKGLKLWVKHNGGPSTKVSIKSCINIDDFAEKVKEKLNTNSQVTLFTSFDKEPLRPGLTIQELLKIEDLQSNCSKTPLYVKLHSVSPYSIASKTIYVRYIDDDGDDSGEYRSVKVKNHRELSNVYKNGEGLFQVSDPATGIVSFDEIEDGKKYEVFHTWQDFARWRKTFGSSLRSG